MARGMYLVSSDYAKSVALLAISLGQHSYLVEEHILSITALGRKVFEVAILVDAVLLTELLPKLASHCIIHIRSCVN